VADRYPPIIQELSSKIDALKLGAHNHYNRFGDSGQASVVVRALPPKSGIASMRKRGTPVRRERPARYNVGATIDLNRRPGDYGSTVLPSAYVVRD